MFTTILATFLIGIALGAVLFAVLRTRLGDPLRLLAASQVIAAALAIAGLVFVLVAPHAPTPGKPLETLQALFGSSLLVVLPVTIALGHRVPGVVGAARGRCRSHAGQGSGGCSRRTRSARSSAAWSCRSCSSRCSARRVLVAVLALVNACLGIALGLGRVARPAGRWIAAIGTVVAVVIVVDDAAPGRPGPARTRRTSRRPAASCSTRREDEIASVQAGQISFTPELWVAGTSMTLLTVDAKLMPVLPLIARPESKDALVVAFGMGSAFRGALIAGLHDRGGRARAERARRCSATTTRTPTAVLADPNGRVIVTDGRNHLELTDKRYDIIITDPPPPIESSGASVISSKEYYEAGRDHLTDGGIMMQWLPYGGPAATTSTTTSGRSTSVFPEVTLVKGAGGYGVYMLGSSRPITFDEANIRAVLARPGVLEDISSAYDSPAKTVDAWVDVITRQTWLTGDEATQVAGDGPLITDDRPRTEYFLLRRLFGSGLP